MIQSMRKYAISVGWVGDIVGKNLPSIETLGMHNNAVNACILCH
jgi:hypothetical protein